MKDSKKNLAMKFLSFVKYFGYLSPSFRIIEIFQFLFLGVISSVSVDPSSFYRFLIISCILAILGSVIIYKIDGKDNEIFLRRNIEAITADKNFTNEIIVPKPVNAKFVLLVIVDTICVVAAGYNIVHEMQKSPIGDNWLSRYKHTLLYIIGSLLLLTCISKILSTWSLQNREVYKVYEEINMSLALSKNIDEWDNNFDEIESYFKQQKTKKQLIRNYKLLPGQDKKTLAYKLALLKINNLDPSNYKTFLCLSFAQAKQAFIDENKEQAIKYTNKLIKDPMSTAESSSTTDIINKYRGLISTIVTGLIIAIYCQWMPAIIPNLPIYAYAGIGILLGIVLITHINSFLKRQSDRIQKENHKFNDRQNQYIAKVLKHDIIKQQLYYMINLDIKRKQPPGSRIMPAVITPIFNFLAIAFPIGYVFHIITKILNLPLFYQSPVSGFIMAISVGALSSAYSWLKTRGGYSDKKNELILETVKPLLGEEIGLQHRAIGTNTGEVTSGTNLGSDTTSRTSQLPGQS